MRRRRMSNWIDDGVARVVLIVTSVMEVVVVVVKALVVGSSR